jgi:hypothetical protein
VRVGSHLSWNISSHQLTNLSLRLPIFDDNEGLNAPGAAAGSSRTVPPSDPTQVQQLLQLAQLPALQHLALLYNSQAAATTASAWQLMPQLQELEICADVPGDMRWQAC